VQGDWKAYSEVDALIFLTPSGRGPVSAGNDDDTQTKGPADYVTIHKVQDAYKLTPLSQWGKEYTQLKNMGVEPSVGNKTPPFVQANNLAGVAMPTPC
jgi:hypothetical protein